MMGREHWIEIPFSDTITALESGSRPKGGVKGITEGIPSIGAEHLNSEGTFNFTNLRFVPFEFADRMNRGKIDFNDILVVKDGATTGKVSIVNNDFPYKVACVNEHVFICRLIKNINVNYCFFFLRSHVGQEQIMSSFHGGAQGGINSEFVHAISIPLPPLKEQKRIVEKLDALLPRVKSAKARLKKIPVILKKFRQSVLAAACSGKLTEDWREKQDPSLKNGHDLLIDVNDFIQSNRIKIKKGASDQLDNHFDPPITWAITHMSNLSYKIVDGVHKKPNYTNSGVPFIQVRNLTAGSGIDFTDVKYVSEKDHEEFYKRANPEKGDILISKDGTLGITRVINTDIVFSIFVSVALVKPFKNFISSQYLCHFINSPFGVLANKNIGEGTGLQHLHLEDLRSLAIPLPPLEEQQEIVRRVEKLFALTDSLESKYKEAFARVEKIEQSILAKAFRGELVEPDPNDEPAEELLKRIMEEKAKLDGGKKTRKPKASKK